MAQQQLVLKLKGLYTSPNDFSSVPLGALSVADNVVIDKESIVESRRGQTQYGEVLDIDSGEINKLFNYKEDLVSSYDDKMAYDSGDGVWVEYTGTYLPPTTTSKIRSLEANGNFYFTTSEGIKKIDELSATPREAGSPTALGGTAALTGSSGFLLDDTAVAYRMLWGYRDENKNLILGAPSQRLVVPNSAGGSRDVVLTYAIPETITTEYFYQIYRSTGSASAATEPSDELQLVIEGNPTSGEIVAKSFSTTDVTPYSLMGATLYTSPSQEGIGQANNQPPYAVDMDVFKNCAFYANVKYKQNLTLTIISADNPSLGYLNDTGNTTNGSAIVTALADTTLIHVGMKVTGSGVPVNTFVLSIDTATQIHITNNATATASDVAMVFADRVTIAGVDYFAAATEDAANGKFKAAGGSTPEEDIYLTALSLVNVVNKYASNTAVYAYYLSGFDDLPGRILFEERSLGGNAFAATSTASSSFSPELPISGTTVSSENNETINRVAFSKTNQPEAVPLLNYFDIGSGNFPILRVVALRDGIFFFKQDGIYRISGEVGAFNVSLVDNTVTLKAPESAVPFNNQVFCFTTQGVCAVTDSGVQIMSVPIENVLLELSSEQFTHFSTATFGVAYESSRQYMLFTVTEEDDTFATQAFIYNSLTNTWTRWVMSRTCGIVGTAVNKLFMGQAETGQVMIERKSYTNDDYADEQYEVEIDSIDSDTEMTLADASNVVAGMSIRQGSTTAYIVDVTGDVITIDDTSRFEVDDAIVYTPIANSAFWVATDADNPGLLKQFSEATYFFQNAAFTEIDASFASNISTAPLTVTLTAPIRGSWGNFAWGSEPWGGIARGQLPLRTYFPRDKQRCSWATMGLSTEEAFTGFSLAGVSIIYNVMSSRFR